MAKALEELYELWDELGDIPIANGEGISKEGCIKEAFLDFQAGTHREDIWKWFEAQNAEFVAGEVAMGQRRQTAIQSGN